jgi:hypothetical protein
MPEGETKRFEQPAVADEVILVASGDLRLAANQTCWPAQRDMEKKVTTAFAAEGIAVRRAHPYDEALNATARVVL